MKKLIVLDIVGLTNNILLRCKPKNLLNIFNSGFQTSMIPSFPAVTCSVQASIFSGHYPSEHGIIANGFYDKKFKQVSFWEQTSHLLEKPRIWDILKKSNPKIKTALLFFQNSLYANSDIVITPKPIHLENKMIMWCYSKPTDLYDNLIKNQGEFNLSWYWGPFASIKSSEWIMHTTLYTIKNYNPELILCYLPHLDYAAQKYGPNSNEFDSSLQELDNIIGNLLEFIKTSNEYEIMVLSEYGFNTVSKSVSPNVILRESKLLTTRTIEGKEYLDYELSKGFAMVDHQVAHVFIKNGYENEVTSLFAKHDGVSEILDRTDQKKQNINHSNSGDIILCSDHDTWFNYYWWNESTKAPDFTFNVDIHRKPGYDPLELFINPATKKISHDTSLIKGSHGIIRNEPNDLPIFGSTINKKVDKTIDVTQIAPTIVKFFNIDTNLPRESIF